MHYQRGHLPLQLDPYERLIWSFLSSCTHCEPDLPMQYVISFPEMTLCISFPWLINNCSCFDQMRGESKREILHGAWWDFEKFLPGTLVILLEPFASSTLLENWHGTTQISLKRFWKKDWVKKVPNYLVKNSNILKSWTKEWTEVEKDKNSRTCWFLSSTLTILFWLET